MLRSMGNGNLFVRSWHSSPDEDSGRNKRRRTFYLDHENPLVKQVLLNHWQNTQIGTENDEPPAETVAETDYEDYVQPAMPEGPDEKRESPFLSRLFRPKR